MLKHWCKLLFSTACLSSFCLCFVGGRADHQSIWRRWWWLWNKPVDWQKLSGFPLQTFLLIMTTRNLEWDVNSLPFAHRCQCWLWTTCTRIWLQWWRTNTGCRDTSPSLTLYRQQRRASDQHSKAPLMIWGKVRGREFKIREYIHPSTLPAPYGVQVVGAAGWAGKLRLPSPQPPSPAHSGGHRDVPKRVLSLPQISRRHPSQMSEHPHLAPFNVEEQPLYLFFIVPLI